MAVLPQVNQFLLGSFLQNTFLIISLFLLPIVVWFMSCTRRSNGKQNLPPSPPRLPYRKPSPTGFTPTSITTTTFSKLWPDLLLLHLGQTPTLVVSSADMVREMIKSNDIVFSNRPETTAPDILLYGCKDVSFSNYGEYWRQLRKVIVLELLSIKRVQQCRFVRNEEVALLVERVRKASLKGDSINLSDIFFGISNNVVSRCVIGKRGRRRW